MRNFGKLGTTGIGVHFKCSIFGRIKSNIRGAFKDDWSHLEHLEQGVIVLSQTHRRGHSSRHV